MIKLILKGSKRFNYNCRSKINYIIFFLGRNVRGRNIHGQNVLAKMSVPETSVAQMAKHCDFIAIVCSRSWVYLLFYGPIRAGEGWDESNRSEDLSSDYPFLLCFESQIDIKFSDKKG